MQRVIVRAVLDAGLAAGTVDVAAEGHTTLRAIARRTRQADRERRAGRRRAVGREPPSLDTTRLRDVWGLVPAWAAAECVADFASPAAAGSRWATG
jgi:hypothetical protein